MVEQVLAARTRNAAILWPPSKSVSNSCQRLQRASQLIAIFKLKQEARNNKNTHLMDLDASGAQSKLARKISCRGEPRADCAGNIRGLM